MPHIKCHPLLKIYLYLLYKLHKETECEYRCKAVAKIESRAHTLWEFSVYKPAAYEYEQIGDSLWLLNGNASTELLAATIGISMDDGESDTFSGYVLGLHGNIPSDGETFEVETERLYIKAIEIKEHIVERAEIFVKPEVDGKKEEDSNEE